MKTLNLILTALLLFILISCNAQEKKQNINELIGKWKVEDKNTFENWEKVSDSYFTGKSYKLNKDQEQITETLEIVYQKGAYVYKATVGDQNQGKTILFKHNKSLNEMLSFENLDHDFPKKIQYKFISNNKILVHVLGENDRGFSYYLIKQDF